ncbi:putative transporter [Trachipleistophora hominis]|uniref:Putative transporter n=1 Tax=Trachipleistophora hominis TaxID=72359 RepID=L7K026_TRAHO|nr:putative transporter [Trachipleistophora hominis]
MTTENLISPRERMTYITLLCALSVLEITFFGLSSFYSRALKFNSLYTIKGSALLLGNLFLVDAIIQKNLDQLYLYPIVYAFTSALVFLGGEQSTGLCLVFKIVEVGLLLFRGFIAFMLLRKIRIEVVWYYFKKLGPSTQLIGKFIS